MTFRKLALIVASSLALGLCAASVSQAHDPLAYGHPNPWGYYYGYPAYGGEYWLRHHSHYVYRPHYWHWHPDVNGYVYNGWGGNYGAYGGGAGPGCVPHEVGGGPLYYNPGARSAPTTTTTAPSAADPFTDDLPEIPELP